MSHVQTKLRTWRPAKIQDSKDSRSCLSWIFTYKKKKKKNGMVYDVGLLSAESTASRCIFLPSWNSTASWSFYLKGSKQTVISKHMVIIWISSWVYRLRYMYVPREGAKICQLPTYSFPKLARILFIALSIVQDSPRVPLSSSNLDCVSVHSRPWVGVRTTTNVNEQYIHVWLCAAFLCEQQQEWRSQHNRQLNTSARRV